MVKVLVGKEFVKKASVTVIDVDHAMQKVIVRNTEGNPEDVWGIPFDVFEDTYVEKDERTVEFNFGNALQLLKESKRVARKGWNGKGMWIEINWSSPGIVVESVCGIEFTESDWIGMKTADNKFVPWLASQTDLLAEDWTVVE